ncbi:MAG: C69 family dipeptidase [Acidobacteria bacterium]|nr:C69 family dipeptidase [Acidobacteriota bacterium]
MVKKGLKTILFLSLILAAPYYTIFGCTNFLITRGASADGSTMITYSADSHVLYGELYFWPAKDYPEGAMLDVYEWDTGEFRGKIKQVRHTYSVVGLMNEHQVSIGETTYGGRHELGNPEAIMDYGSLMFIALQRSKTAREAIQVIADLCDEYGYYSEGESLSIMDKNEVWIMEIIGKGPGNNKGALWVARRVPDGYICAHANQARIKTFPLNDPENCMYAKDVISFAREKGYFDGKDEDFSFSDTYAPATFEGLRFCEARVWSMFRRAAPSLNLSPDYAMGVDGAESMPLWIKPDKKLTPHDVMELMRDHFENSPMDLSVGLGAGPYKLPYRWRGLTWEVDGVEYLNERATSTQQTGFSFVSQARKWLPDPVGGIFWFGVDDTASTVYVPMYCGMTKVPHAYAVGTGDFQTFTWDSAFWVFNIISNWAYSRYSEIIVEVQKVQRELEAGFITGTKEIDKKAAQAYKTDPCLARKIVTDYSVAQGDMTVKTWRELFPKLFLKFMDGNYRNEDGRVTHPGYPEEWYKRIAAVDGEKLLVKPLKSEIERGYKEAVKHGDESLLKKDFSTAKKQYENALKLKKDAEYPKAQLKKIENILAEIDKMVKAK